MLFKSNCPSAEWDGREDIAYEMAKYSILKL